MYWIELCNYRIVVFGKRNDVCACQIRYLSDKTFTLPAPVWAGESSWRAEGTEQYTWREAGLCPSSPPRADNSRRTHEVSYNLEHIVLKVPVGIPVRKMYA